MSALTENQGIDSQGVSEMIWALRKERAHLDAAILELERRSEAPLGWPPPVGPAATRGRAAASNQK